jgi:hypothetical protein
METPDFLIGAERKQPTHVKDVTGATQLINNVKTVDPQKVEQPSDIINLLDEYWQKRGVANNYQMGVLLGKGDVANIQLKEFFKKFKHCLETIIRNELVSQDKTSEEFKDDFKTLEHLFYMIASHIEKTGIKLDNEKTLAILNGFINSYITSLKNG